MTEQEEVESESYVVDVGVAHLQVLVGGVLLLQKGAFELVMMREMNCQILTKKKCPKIQYSEMAHCYTNQWIACKTKTKPTK